MKKNSQQYFGEKICEYSNRDFTIMNDLLVDEDEILILRNCTMWFAPEVGIFSTGKIIAENVRFLPIQKGWKGIADIGKEHSIFKQCHFIGGRGRTLNEFKEHYISRYFDEMNDLEITRFWRGYRDENCFKAYEEGTYGGVLITLNSRIEDCRFEDCRVTRDGGAILSTFRVSIEGCHFERCRAGKSGGAVCAKEYTIISKSKFISCRARQNGGGVSGIESAQVFSCHFFLCIASTGGGVYGAKGTMVNDSLFKKCIATYKGGGVSGSIQGERLIFNRCFSRNGGGASLEEATLLLNSTFYRCHANKEGGGLDLGAYKMALVEGCRFISNQAEINAAGASVRATTLRGCLWRNNKINPSKIECISADQLYATHNTLIDKGVFIGCRVEEFDIPTFLLFESIMYQSDYCEEHIDLESDVLMSTIVPKPLDGYHTTSMCLGDIQFHAVINDIVHAVVLPKNAAWSERITVELAEDETEVKFYGSMYLITKEEEKSIRQFVVQNYIPLKDHWESKTSSKQLFQAIRDKSPIPISCVERDTKQVNQKAKERIRYLLRKKMNNSIDNIVKIMKDGHCKNLTDDLEKQE
jgi:hypothetical protein